MTAEAMAARANTEAFILDVVLDSRKAWQMISVYRTACQLNAIENTGMDELRSERDQWG
jgi:hypothetical protein